ncbi:MAG: DUF1598 domain-containing protein [Planctomycetota bacterium]
MRTVSSPLAMPAALALVVMTLGAGLAEAQFARFGAVGGVLIDTRGVVSAPEKGEDGAAFAAWQAGRAPVPGDLQKYTDLRFVSLRGIEEQLAAAAESGEPVADSVMFLGGLLRVQYVLIYPPTDEKPAGDIVLAGPAEGWVIDQLGNAVGATTRRPVLYYEDLMVAMRTTEAANGRGISCSIDPTAEGIANAQRVGRNHDPSAGPAAAARRLQQALGQQVITIAGVPETSHFARTLVAADFRMKRLAMNFEASPVSNLPSYLDMIPDRSTRAQSMLPRWWMAPSYEPLRVDSRGLAWELRGQGVKCLTEESVADAAGNLTRSSKPNPFAEKWAEAMTASFEELAGHDSAFGHLRNVMDLAVVAALIAKEDALKQAKLELPQLAGETQIEAYPAPRAVDTQVSFVRKRGRYILSASGGVQMYPWEIADRSEQSDTLAPVRSAAVAKSTGNWWWE